MPKISSRNPARRWRRHAVAAVLLASLTTAAVAIMYRTGIFPSVASARAAENAAAAVPASSTQSDALAPDAAFLALDGTTKSVSQFRGKPTMLWLLSTWCSSCAAGLQTMAERQSELQAAGLQVLVLRNYQNAGYSGPDVAAFVREVLPQFNVPKYWTLGQATAALDSAYNPRHYPDIYFLIDHEGHVRAVDSAPSATVDEIVNFARAQGSGGT